MTMSNNDNLPSPGNNAASGTRGPSIAFIALAVVAGLALVFFLQNSEPVYIDFLFFEKKTTIRWSILMAILLGVLLDRIATIVWRRRKKSKSERNEQNG